MVLFSDGRPTPIDLSRGGCGWVPHLVMGLLMSTTDSDPTAPNDRSACPICASGDITDPVSGTTGPVTATDPDGVRHVGSMGSGYDSRCGSCGATWNRQQRTLPKPIRLLSKDGASFALLPVLGPDSVGISDVLAVDIELLAPTRLVRYLGRRLSLQSLENLSVSWMQAALDDHPELTVPTVQDDEAGLAVQVIQSTPFTVTIEVLLVIDPEEDVADYDGLAFEIPRSVLIDAAHAASGWLE